MAGFFSKATTVIMAIQLITGCTARIPEATAYPYSQQMKIQAVHHWQI
ncbi:hypothetical protein [Desulfosediminicola ganghwensis]|nr:hypothetical protein [Desulfosediminicola ganghwensis]